MPTITTNLGLNKTDTTSDGGGSFVDKNEYFNFDTDLNDNWDKIDAATGKLSNLTTTEKGSLVGAINEVIGSIPDVSGKVSKSGDTMTGTLNFDKSMSGISPITCISSQFNHVVDANNLPSSKLYAGRILVADNAEINKAVYTEHSRLNMNGDVARFFNVYNYDANGDEHYAELALFVDVNGNDYFRFPRCTTKPTTVSTASQNSVCVVVENYVNGSSWYRKWSDGFIEQGGTNTLTGNSSTQISLLKSFSNTNYTVAGLHSFSVTGSQKNAYLYSKAKGSFNVYLYGTTGGDPAISWYACGY